jgi:nitrite reductase/ring-hydroxylating ferredoxin subunit
MSTTPLPSLYDTRDDCSACGPCPGRRDFLRTGLEAAALAALAAFLPGRAGAAEIAWTQGDTSTGALRYPAPAADGVAIDKVHEAILVRRGATVFVAALSCPHQRSMLRWREGDGVFQCTKHHSEYSPLGVYEKGRATRNMDRMAVRLEGREIVADPSTLFHSDEDPQGWASAVVTLP